jgi:hypothetical protein
VDAVVPFYLEHLLGENKYRPQASLPHSPFLMESTRGATFDVLSLITPSIASYFTPIISITSSSIFDFFNRNGFQSLV